MPLIPSRCAFPVAGFGTRRRRRGEGRKEMTNAEVGATPEVAGVLRSNRTSDSRASLLCLRRRMRRKTDSRVPEIFFSQF